MDCSEMVSKKAMIWFDSLDTYAIDELAELCNISRKQLRKYFTNHCRVTLENAIRISGFSKGQLTLLDLDSTIDEFIISTLDKYCVTRQIKRKPSLQN